MFKLKKIRKINWPVIVNIPQDGGTVIEESFTAEFELISQKEYDSFFVEATADKPAGEKDIGLVRRVLTGWGADACDEEGNPMEFNAENKEKMIEMAYARSGIIKAYIACLYGNGKVKNS